MNRHAKKILRRSLTGLVALSFLTALAAASARAQSREEHLISARAGGVNFVSGDVRRRSGEEVGWQKLTTKDDLQTGDEVRTGNDGLAEVLLNPGSYFRAGESSQFELVDASLDNLRLRISRGSAVIEATGYDKLGLNIAVATPQAHARIMRTGVYRFTVLPSGDTEVAVQKGLLAVLQGGQEQVVKGGQVARFRAGAVEVAKLDKNKRDALDLWSRERGKELAQLNEKLASRQVNSMFARVSFNGLFSPRYPYGGVWVFNPRLSCYTFLPFYDGWSSPYGFGYGSFWPGGFYAGCGCAGDGRGPYNAVERPRGSYPPPSSTSGGYAQPSRTTPGGPYSGGTPASTPPAPRTDIERDERPVGHGKMINPPR